MRKIRSDEQTLASLASSPAGLFRGPIDSYVNAGRSRLALTTVVADFSNLSMPTGVNHARRITSSGTGLTHEISRMPAIAEALERYCSSVYCDDQLVSASSRDLDAECLDLDIVPRCSTSELAHERCPLIAPSKDHAIRWVKGVSLTERRVEYLPAVMCFSHLRNIVPTERFWLPISTGCAAHFDLATALFNAACEVIERDAISLIWLHQTPLYRIELDVLPAELVPYQNVLLGNPSSIHYEFYNATSELGVPTVYGLRIDKSSEHGRTFVACSTAGSVTEAIAKVFRDLVAFSASFRTPPKYPEKVEDFTGLLHGASYMASMLREGAFAFLRNNSRRVSLQSLVASSEPIVHISALLTSLRRCGMSAYAINLATDEAERVGLHVVKVIIPKLQPLSFHYLARFLGHARVYNAPTFTANVTCQESQLNALPQPFA